MGCPVPSLPAELPRNPVDQVPTSSVFRTLLPDRSFFFAREVSEGMAAYTRQHSSQESGPIGSSGRRLAAVLLVLHWI